MESDPNDIVTLRTGQVTTKIEPEFREILEPRLTSMDWDDFEELKRSTVRTVRRGTITGPDGRTLDVHVKLYRAVKLSDHARDALGGSRGVREFDRLGEARARGLPCVRPLAAGRETGSAGSRSFLVTESLDAHPMPRRGWDAELAAAAGRLLRQAHDAGLHAPDLHPENVLVPPDGQLALCDLTSVTLANPLEFEQRSRALGFFCLELDGLVEDPIAAPLLAGYDAEPELVADAQRQARRLRNRAMTAFGRRATRACRHTEVLVDSESRPPTRWFLHRPAADLHAEARAWQPGTPTKSGRRGSVHVGDHLVVKERDAASATRLFRAAYWLIQAGVPTPRPVALSIRHGRGRVFTQRLPWPDLTDDFPTMTDEEKLTAARRLGDAVGRLHALGLRNRDLKFENLVRDPESGVVHMVDLDGVRRRKPLERRGEAHDLGRLLAAYRLASDSRTSSRLLRAFVRSYHAAFRCLRQTPNPRLRKHSEARAREWANAHPSTPAP